jgi:uncharacterized membrane protein
MSEHKGAISIWLFIGALLLLYGLLIIGAEFWASWNPPGRPVELAGYHFGYWMGGVLTLLGGYYCLHFRPGKR